MDISRNTIIDIIKCCNRDLVPDYSVDPRKQHHSDWFQEYFSFLKKEKESIYLGEYFYQERFIYKIMFALRCPLKVDFLQLNDVGCLLLCYSYL